MGNTISQHLAAIDYLSKVEKTSDIDIQKFVEEYEFEPSASMIVALMLIKNPDDKLSESSVKADANANDEEYSEGQYLFKFYHFYTEVWKIIPAAVLKHEETMEAIVEEKAKYPLTKRFRYEFKVSGNEAILKSDEHVELTKNNEWVGIIHKCGFVGYRYNNVKCCNECIGRHLGNFVGNHAPFDSYTLNSLDSLSFKDDFECTDQIILSGIYNMQTKKYPKYTPDSLELKQE